MKITLPTSLLALILYASTGYAASEMMNDSAGYDPYMMSPTEPDNYSTAPAETGEFSYSLPVASPDFPYILPNEFSYEHLGSMKADRGGSHLSLTNVKLSIPLADPHRSGWSTWHLDAKISLKMTWVNSSGKDLIDLNRLYTVAPLVGLSRKIGSYGMLSVALTPQFSSDFDTSSSHNFYFGGFAAYSGALSESFTFSAGVACLPDYSNTWFVPLVQFKWKVLPVWQLKLENTRLSFDNVASSRFEWGPFIGISSGTWTVNRHKRTEQFRWSSGVAGLGAAFNLTPAKQTKFLLRTDVGFSFANKAKFRTKNGKHTIDSYDYDPGFYLKAGLDVRF